MDLPLPNPIKDNLKVQLADFLRLQFKELIEEKHLYQNILIDHEKMFKNETVKKTSGSKSKKYVLELLKKKWWPVTQNYDKTQFPDNFFNTVQPFAVPDVKLYCRICKRKEPYNPILATDFIYHGIKYSLSEIPNTAQVFFISYSCQSCKSFPEVIQIRRDNLKLTIAGRAPMEFIEVPKEIPKQINSFYSSAVIAFQSGQSLAANFLFRTLIEQWCYFSVSEKLESADQALESYMNELPDDFKDRFYSLRELYKSLSEDIHKAKGDEKLFKEVKEKIDEHFQARLLFKI